MQEYPTEHENIHIQQHTGPIYTFQGHEITDVLQKSLHRVRTDIVLFLFTFLFDLDLESCLGSIAA